MSDSSIRKDRALRYRIIAGLLFFGVTLCEVARSDESETVEDILAREPQRSDYGGRSVQCINPRGIGRHEILSSRFVYLDTIGEGGHLLELQTKCHGLRPGVVFGFERKWAKLCINDVVYAFPAGVGDIRGPDCGISRIEKITSEQLESIRYNAQIE